MDKMGDCRPKWAKLGQMKDYGDKKKNCDDIVVRLEICGEGAYFEENYVNGKSMKKITMQHIALAVAV